jgi:hypothetical protein
VPTIPPEPPRVTIAIATRPAGATIFVDGNEVEGVRTPAPFQLPRRDTEVRVTLRLPSYEDAQLRLVPAEDRTLDLVTLKRKRGASPPDPRRPPRTGSATGSGTGPGSSKGSGATTKDDTGLMRPD